MPKATANQDQHRPESDGDGQPDQRSGVLLILVRLQAAEAAKAGMPGRGAGDAHAAPRILAGCHQCSHLCCFPIS